MVLRIVKFLWSLKCRCHSNLIYRKYIFNLKSSYLFKIILNLNLLSLIYIYITIFKQITHMKFWSHGPLTIVLNNCDYNIDQNNCDYDFCHNWAALAPWLPLSGWNPWTHCQTLHWCSGSWVPPGARQCPESMQAVPGGFKSGPAPGMGRGGLSPPKWLSCPPNQN